MSKASHTKTKISDQPLELILKHQIEQDKKIEASFDKLFKIGNQNYVSLENEEHIYLLKVSKQENGNYQLNNITSEHEFTSVHEVYQQIAEK